MTVSNFNPSQSPRAKLADDFAAWLRDTNRFTAPYGILVGLTSTKGKGKARSVTFGVARISDVNLQIFSEKYMVLQDSRYGSVKCTSIDEVKEVLKENYKL